MCPKVFKLNLCVAKVIDSISGRPVENGGPNRFWKS